MPSFVEYYQLQRNPFEGEDHPFVDFGGRADLIEAMLHEAQFGHLGQLILAPLGAGKSTVLERIVSRAPSATELVLLDADEIDSDKPVMAEIAQQLGISIGKELSTDAIIQKLRSQIEQRVILLIDDVEHYPLDTLQALERLLPKSEADTCPFRMIAFAASKPAFSADYATVMVTHPLSLLSKKDILPYLQQYFSSAGISAGVPLERKEIDALLKRSQGLPSKVNQLAEGFFQQKADKASRPGSISLFPLTHIAAVAVVITAIVFAFLYGDWNTSVSEVAQPEPNEEIESTPRTANSILAKLDEAYQQSLSEDPVIEREENFDDTTIDSVPVVASQKLESTTQYEMTLNTETMPLGSEEAEVKAKIDADSSLTTPLPPVEPELSLWTEAVDPTHFTLQLVGGRSIESVKSFVAEQGLVSPLLAIMEGSLSDQPWYVLIMGDFATKEQAIAAINGLPESLRSTKPWARPHSDLAQYTAYPVD